MVAATELPGEGLRRDGARVLSIIYANDTFWELKNFYRTDSDFKLDKTCYQIVILEPISLIRLR